MAFPSETGGAANVTQLADGNPNGTSMGQSAADLISFYNVTPVAQQAAVTAVSTAAIAPVSTAALTTGAVYGFATAAAGLAIATAINALITQVASMTTSGNSAGTVLHNVGLTA